MKKNFVFLSIIFLFSLVLASNALALTNNEIDRIIINSADWRDVYSGVMYSNLI
jgi:hypothetical protein